MGIVSAWWNGSTPPVKPLGSRRNAQLTERGVEMVQRDGEVKQHLGYSDGELKRNGTNPESEAGT